MEFFSPFLPFLEVKESCCMVRVAGQEIAGTGGDPNSQGSTGVTHPCSAYLGFQHQKQKISCAHFILSELWEIG